jgi:hypothetical protein
VRHVAHPAIRNRGTLGGSIALADPAAEYPACMVALDASIVITGAAGERLVKAQHFFKGLFEVDLAPGELVAAVEVPAQLKDQRSVFLEATTRSSASPPTRESRRASYSAAPVRRRFWRSRPPPPAISTPRFCFSRKTWTRPQTSTTAPPPSCTSPRCC